ncbi:MAG: methyltransferase domain-containing protein [Alphaproteobacteria bacterium]|nr:methyltransferase domain-containing protein [Alphaproteobacteria bacterium]
MLELATTDDGLLDGRIVLRQPAKGYRAAIDPLMLAGAVPARGADCILDLGCGAGAGALALAARLPQAHVTGVELDPGMAGLFAENILVNGFSDRLEAVTGDIAALTPELCDGRFDHVMMNPPYLEALNATPSPDPRKQQACVEGAARLADWIEAGLAGVRCKGSITVIHRADRLDDIIALLHGRAGGVVVFPLWPKKGEAAKRVIVSACKGVRSPARVSPGLVLHRADGAFTPETDAILRGAGALVM